MFLNVIPRKFNEMQYLPSENDVNNEKVKELSRRLKGKSNSETLNNILEWQENNISPWIERSNIFIIVLSIIFFPFFISMLLINFYGVEIGLFTIYIFLVILFIMWLFLAYDNYFKNSKFFDKVKNTFLMTFDTVRLRLSTEKILKYRKAVCRDYAKLTASLLLNLYPENKIYFLLPPRHVATAIEIENKRYVIDQKMPILDEKTWLNRFNEKKVKVYQIKRDGRRLILKKSGNVKLEKNERVKFDPEFINISDLEKAIENNQQTFEYLLKGYSNINLPKNKIINESLLRAIRNKINHEFCSNSSKLKAIKLDRKGEDLLVKILINN